MNMPMVRSQKEKIPTTVEALVELKAHLEAENQMLKKQLAGKESDKVKAMAVLEQKVTLLTAQLAESHERETTLKRLQEKTMLAL